MMERKETLAEMVETHLNVWRKALEYCRDQSYSDADRLYYAHELKALDDILAAVKAETEGLDMLLGARTEIDMIREALGVSIEPHQSLSDRMYEAAVKNTEDAKKWRLSGKPAEVHVSFPTRGAVAGPFPVIDGCVVVPEHTVQALQPLTRAQPAWKSWQSRVAFEKAELDERIEKLYEFLSTASEARRQISTQQLRLLNRQLDTMVTLSAILGERLRDAPAST